MSSFDLSNGLRRWFFFFFAGSGGLVAGRLGVQVPDASSRLHATDQLAATVVASDAPLSFRMAMLRNTLRLDYAPGGKGCLQLPCGDPVRRCVVE